MEATIQIINWIANVIFGGSLTAFYIMIFGDESKIVHRWPFVQNWTEANASGIGFECWTGLRFPLGLFISQTPPN